MRNIVIFTFCLVIAFVSCKKEVVETNTPELPENPFDGVDYSDIDIPPMEIDPASFLGLHNEIFSIRCAQQACHDGAFEPDFRTVNSSYNSLVYRDVFKNNATNDYVYRVVPGDTALSWLHERITTEDSVLGRMPLYDVLEPEKIKLIEDWILDGAPNMFGEYPNAPDLQLSFININAFVNDTNGYRLDTVRGGISYYPFLAPANTNISLWFGMYDGDDWFLPPILDQKIQFSVNSPDNFGPELDMDYASNPLEGWNRNNNTKYPFYVNYTVNTSQFNSGDIVYMRIKVFDSEHTNPSVMPPAGSSLYYYGRMAFVIP